MMGVRGVRDRVEREDRLRDSILLMGAENTHCMGEMLRGDAIPLAASCMRR